MNNLIRSCEGITKAGYRLVNVPILERPGFYDVPEIWELGSYLLNYNQPEEVNYKFNLAAPKGGTSNIEEKYARNDKTYKLAIMWGVGIDSTSAIFRALDTFDSSEIICIWVEYEQPYSEKEASAFDQIKRSLPNDINTLKVASSCKAFPEDETPWGYIVPARNLFLAAIGSYFSNEIWIVATKRVEAALGAADKTNRFFENSSAIFSEYYGESVKVTSPFYDVTKPQVVKYVRDNWPQEVDTLKLTNTCYNPEKEFCGVCKSCYKRWIAMTLNGIKEDYLVEPPETDVFWDKYIWKEKSYGFERYADLLTAILRYRYGR